MNHRTKSHVSVYLKRGGSIQLLVLSCLRLLETTECRFLSSVDGPGGVHADVLRLVTRSNPSSPRALTRSPRGYRIPRLDGLMGNTSKMAVKTAEKVYSIYLTWLLSNW